MKVKVPTEINLGSYQYAVRFWRRMIYDHGLLGQSLTDCQLIKVEYDSNPQTMAVTFWHEIFHAVKHTYGCEIDENDADRLAHGIVQVLQSMGIELDWEEIESMLNLEG